jgi:hypothetical protein
MTNETTGTGEARRRLTNRASRAISRAAIESVRSRIGNSRKLIAHLPIIIIKSFKLHRVLPITTTLFYRLKESTNSFGCGGVDLSERLVGRATHLDLNDAQLIGAGA